MLRAVLNAGIGPIGVDAIFELDFKVVHLCLVPDQEGIGLGGILFGGPADDRAVLNAPELLIAFPTV